MSESLRAVVVHGAAAERPDETDTIIQAETVAAALARLGWRVEIHAVGLDLSRLDRLLTPRPALVFNLVESLAGDGRLIHLVPAVLEHLGVPFTGARAAAHFITTNKPVAKGLMRAAGLPTPEWIAAEDAASALAHDCRAIVKPSCEDASLGIDASSVVPAFEASATIAERAARHGGDWFAETFIDGREFNVGLLEGPGGITVLPIAEIRFVDFPPNRPRIVDYEAKWTPGSFAYDNTPRFFDLPAADAPLLQRLGGLSEQAFRLFGLGGYARVDFRVDENGQPWILEVNANPCLAPDAGFIAAAAGAGLTLDDVVQRIAATACVKRARKAA